MSQLCTSQYETHLATFKEFCDSVPIDKSDLGLYKKKQDAYVALQHLEMMGKWSRTSQVREDDEGCDSDHCTITIQVSVSN